VRPTQKAEVDERVNNNRIGDTVIIIGIAVLVVGLSLSISILATTGGVLLTVGLIVWILRQSQSVVLASLRLRYSAAPPTVSKAVADSADRGHCADYGDARHTEWT
jgi:hypothetical protein